MILWQNFNPHGKGVENLETIIMIIIMFACLQYSPYLSPLYFLTFSCLKYPARWIWFLVNFKLEFYRLQQTEIFVETRKKSSSSNSMFQTRELKNRVQIDWRSVCNLYWITAKCRTWQVIRVKHGFKIRVLCLVSVANLYSKIT